MDKECVVLGMPMVFVNGDAVFDKQCVPFFADNADPVPPECVELEAGHGFVFRSCFFDNPGRTAGQEEDDEDYEKNQEKR